MHTFNTGPIHGDWIGAGIYLFWNVLPTGSAGLHRSGVGCWSGRHRAALAGRWPRIIAGNFILAALGDFKRKAWLLVGSLLMLCAFLIAFAWSPWYWVSWILFFFVGATSTGLFWPLANTLVQLNVPSELRGRVLAALQIAPAIHFLSALPLAVAGDAISWPIAITGAGAMTLLVALWLGLWRPMLRRFEG